MARPPGEKVPELIVSAPASVPPPISVPPWTRMPPWVEPEKARVPAVTSKRPVVAKVPASVSVPMPCLSIEPDPVIAPPKAELAPLARVRRPVPSAMVPGPEMPATVSLKLARSKAAPEATPIVAPSARRSLAPRRSVPAWTVTAFAAAVPFSTEVPPML